METKELHYLYDCFLKASRIETDSRNIAKGDIFFALKGDSFDGNDFAHSANEKGALFTVVDRPELKGLPNYIFVDDVLSALQELARLHRSKLKIPVIGITGSNGKTTTKELITAVLSTNLNCQSTKGNLNNHIGVPLTILSIRNEHEIAVVEMGANHPGEIAFLCNIAKPDFGIITNIGKAHLEGFGGFEGVIRTKNELYLHLSAANATAFVPADNPLLMKLSASLKRILYGKRDNCDVQGEIVSSDPFLTLLWNLKYIKTKLIGDYNFDNVMAAITIGKYFGAEDDKITEALQNYSPGNNRSQVQEGKYNTIIMDAYNANPSSMEAALRNIQMMKYPKKAAILGDMLELGVDSRNEHKRIFNLASQIQFDILVFVGPVFKSVAKDSICFEDVKHAREWLAEAPIKDALVLTKGSRGIQLEKLFDLL